MKAATKILAVWGCIATLPLLYLLLVYLDSEGIVEFRRHSGVDYYYPADLQTMNLPSWDATNAIALPPEAAVKAAMRYASEQHPTVTAWDVDRIELRRWPSGPWFYNVFLVDRQSGGYYAPMVSVLLDGNIWKPSKEERTK